ncbi:MAG: hypothetical protein CMJ58_20810 [Planctomycetaceae bacterium]|nr:hypothetical protein [Planctomycetaceae bacterium]
MSWLVPLLFLASTQPSLAADEAPLARPVSEPVVLSEDVVARPADKGPLIELAMPLSPSSKTLSRQQQAYLARRLRMEIGPSGRLEDMQGDPAWDAVPPTFVDRMIAAGYPTSGCVARELKIQRDRELAWTFTLGPYQR